MNDRHPSMKQRSRRLSWLLRHGAAESGLAMSPEGWARIEDVLGLVSMSREELRTVVEENDKRRFELDGDRVRASQGHSSAIVSLDGVEASWEELPLEIATAWHGTHVDAIEGIRREGILPRARTHVHLAESADAHVGKRAGVDLLLGVSVTALRAAGLQVFRSPNGVVLVRAVPTGAIIEVRAVTRAGAAAMDSARTLVGLASTGSTHG
jgi:putative RNA 2'-phosphotransferase